MTGPVGPRTRRRTGFGASGAGAVSELAAGAAGHCLSWGWSWSSPFFGFSGGAAVSALGRCCRISLCGLSDDAYRSLAALLQGAPSSKKLVVDYASFAPAICLAAGLPTIYWPSGDSIAHPQSVSILCARPLVHGAQHGTPTQPALREAFWTAQAYARRRKHKLDKQTCRIDGETTRMDAPLVGRRRGRDAHAPDSAQTRRLHNRSGRSTRGRQGALLHERRVLPHQRRAIQERHRVRLRAVRREPREARADARARARRDYTGVGEARHLPRRDGGERRGHPGRAAPGPAGRPAGAGAAPRDADQDVRRGPEIRRRHRARRRVGSNPEKAAEIDGSDRALAAAATDLDAAQGALRTLVAVGGDGRGARSWTCRSRRAAAPTGAAAGRSTRRASTSRGRTWRRGSASSILSRRRWRGRRRGRHAGGENARTRRARRMRRMHCLRRRGSSPWPRARGAAPSSTGPRPARRPSRGPRGAPSPRRRS